METIPSDPRDTLDRETVLVELALQGGGSHGAFTWGALDRLLQETRFKIEGVSGTSAAGVGMIRIEAALIRVCAGGKSGVVGVGAWCR